MFEFIKEIGSLVGLFTGLFVFYDRYARGRPIASLSFERNGKRTWVVLRISNAGPYDAAILCVSCRPDVYRLATDMEVKNVLRATIGEPLFFILKPSESRNLFLVSRVENGLALEVTAQRITFRISWKRANSTWLWQVPIFVRADTAFIRQFGLEHS